MGTYNFTHVHICDNAGHTADYPIKSWTDDGDGYSEEKANEEEESYSIC